MPLPCPCGGTHPKEGLPVPLASCKHAQHNPELLFFSSSKGQLPMPEFIKLSLKKVKSRSSPLMGSPASHSFWAPTGAV